MKYTISQEGLSDLSSYWGNPKHKLDWSSVFTLPRWLQVWWQTFGGDAELFIRAVREGEEVIGIAPLQLRESTVSFIGSADVCDYLDFVVAPGRERDFFGTLLDHLKERGIDGANLGPVRQDSKVLNRLADAARERGCRVDCAREDVSLELELPSGWDEYLELLTTKQRHEVRRKLRRLSEAGGVDYRFIADGAALPGAMETFLKMFRQSRPDKAAFLTGHMESFFRSLAAAMADAGLLRLGILELDGVPQAAIMCFDYHDCVYLYNSGYDPRSDVLSVGLMSKVLGIKDSIERGRAGFDFLKGAEPYKYHLGGREVPIYRCRIGIR